MKRKIFSGIMLTVLSVSILTLAFNIQLARSEPRTWTVDDDGPADFSTIQEAINAASSGDMIYVYNGTFYESPTVNKTIHLCGENRKATIVDGRIYVDSVANNVEISEFTLGSGISLNSSNNMIQGNVIRDTGGIGIVTFVRTSHNIISNNLIANNTSGIHAYGTDHVIQRNIIINNTRTGIHTIKGPQRSDKIRIIENTINNNEIAVNICGYHNIVYKNMIANNTNVGINFAGDTLVGMVVNNTIANNGYGILTDFHDDYHTIYGNNLSSNLQGIYLQFSDDNTIYGNTIETSELGINLRYSDDNIIHHNNFIRNEDQNYLYQSSGNTWDNGTEGNYWSDYEGEDNDGDGIGDTDLPHLGVDVYPLMELFKPDPMVPTLKERFAGVETGDWMKYDSVFTYSGLGVPPSYVDIENREWIRNTVQEVSDPIVTFEMIIHYTNGTEQTEIKHSDVDYGGGSPYWFISADLEPGDNMYTTSSNLIEETVFLTYAGETREVNHLIIDTIYYKPAIWPPSDGPDRIVYNLYWDKSTGVLCEWTSDEFWDWQGTSLYMFWSLEILDTNLWPRIPIPGDIDGDGDVDAYDFGTFAWSYGASIGQPKYHVGCDLDQDGDIDGYDFGTFALNYGKTV